jgi:uncharacterized protein with ACT and thioredoxin-like domain
MSVDITLITDSNTGTIKKINNLLLILNGKVIDYETFIEEKGESSDYELFNEIIDELEFIQNKVKTLIYKLQQIPAVGKENNFRAIDGGVGLPNIENEQQHQE